MSRPLGRVLAAAALVSALALGALVAPAGAVGSVAHALSGGRTTLGAALLVAALSLCVGVPLGVLAGLGRDLGDGVLARSSELVGALPLVVLVPLVAARSGGETFLAFVGVLGAWRALEVARVVRAELLRTASEDFALAARALGAGGWRLQKQLVPHALGAGLVSAAFAPAAVVALEAALGLAGLGLPEQSASWGAQLGRAASEGGHAFAAPVLLAIAATAALQLLADETARRLRGRVPSGVTGTRIEAAPARLATPRART